METPHQSSFIFDSDEINHKETTESSLRRSLIPNNLLPKELITIIDENTAAYHHDSETIICNFKKSNDQDQLIIRSMITNHPHLEHYYGTVASEMWILTEVVSPRTFKDIIENLKLDRKTIWKLIIQIATGLQHLHSHNLIHRNICLDNILFRYRHNSYEAIITNFNQTIKILDDSSIFPSTEKNISKSVDALDFGILIWQAFHKGEVPGSPLIFDDLPATIKDIINDCLNENVEKRPTFDDIFLDRLNKISFEEAINNWSYCIIS